MKISMKFSIIGFLILSFSILYAEPLLASDPSPDLNAVEANPELNSDASCLRDRTRLDHAAFYEARGPLVLKNECDTIIMIAPVQCDGDCNTHEVNPHHTVSLMFPDVHPLKRAQDVYQWTDTNSKNGTFTLVFKRADFDDAGVFGCHVVPNPGLTQHPKSVPVFALLFFLGLIVRRRATEK